jgi:hypothetical protein
VQRHLQNHYTNPDLNNPGFKKQRSFSKVRKPWNMMGILSTLAKSSEVNAAIINLHAISSETSNHVTENAFGIGRKLFSLT